MAVSNPATFSSVRTEFAPFGTSTSLYAYRRGGGIIPDVSQFSGIGLGTEASPLKLSQFAGLSAFLDQQTVTVGLDTIPVPFPGSGTFYYYGWGNGYGTIGMGSISDGTSNLYGGASIVYLWARYLNTPGNYLVSFTVSGNRANSGWTTLDIAGYTYSRSSATYAYESTPNHTTWSWSGGSVNPFGTTVGATKICTWT